MADFNEIQSEIANDEEIADLPISKKDGSLYLAPDGSPATIGVLGSDAKKVKAARDANQRKLLRNRQTKMTPEDLRANRLAFASAAVVRWSGWTVGDQPFEFTPENVRKMLGAEHILEQIEEGIAGHASFFEKSSTA